MSADNEKTAAFVLGILVSACVILILLPEYPKIPISKVTNDTTISIKTGDTTKLITIKHTP